MEDKKIGSKNNHKNSFGFGRWLEDVFLEVFLCVGLALWMDIPEVRGQHTKAHQACLSSDFLLNHL